MHKYAHTHTVKFIMWTGTNTHIYTIQNLIVSVSSGSAVYSQPDRNTSGHLYVSTQDKYDCKHEQWTKTKWLAIAPARITKHHVCLLWVLLSVMCV